MAALEQDELLHHQSGETRPQLLVPEQRAIEQRVAPVPLAHDDHRLAATPPTMPKASARSLPPYVPAIAVGLGHRVALPVLQLHDVRDRRYGNFVARSDVGHTLAVSEALIGQIYLVTVVSLIVSILRRPRRDDVRA